MDNPGEIMRFCRLCLVKDQVNIPIFEEQGDIRQIFLKISSCLPVKVSREDKLPKKICDGCSNKLDLLYEFWNTSANAEKTLLSWLGQAGVKDVDQTITAVAQQIAKPSEPQVKEETPEDGHAAVQNTDHLGISNSAVLDDSSAKDETEEPPPKRARRTAAVKAQINLTPDSEEEDDDLDTAEPMTKIEDESDESDNDDKDPSYVDVPGTSADDQPGPSGVGKDGAEAPFHSLTKEAKEDYISRHFSKKCEVVLVDCTKARKKYTCYVCFYKFYSKLDLDQHKKTHNSINDKSSESDSDYVLSEESDTDEVEPKPAKGTKKFLFTKNAVPSEDNAQEVKKIADLESLGREKLVLTPADDLRISNEKMPYKCINCKTYFSNRFEIRAHKNTAECKYFCLKCNRNFSTKSALGVHIIQHEVENKSTKFAYSCESCELVFSDCYQLKRHHAYTKHHKKDSSLQNNNSLKPCLSNSPQSLNPNESMPSASYECEVCFDVFNTNAALLKHKALHVELDIKEQIQHDEENKRRGAFHRSKKSTLSQEIIEVEDDTETASSTSSKEIPLLSIPDSDTNTVAGPSGLNSVDLLEQYLTGSKDLIHAARTTSDTNAGSVIKTNIQTKHQHQSIVNKQQDSSSLVINSQTNNILQNNIIINSGNENTLSNVGKLLYIIFPNRNNDIVQRLLGNTAVQDSNSSGALDRPEHNKTTDTRDSAEQKEYDRMVMPLITSVTSVAGEVSNNKDMDTQSQSTSQEQTTEEPKKNSDLRNIRLLPKPLRPNSLATLGKGLESASSVAESLSDSHSKESSSTDNTSTDNKPKISVKNIADLVGGSSSGEGNCCQYCKNYFIDPAAFSHHLSEVIHCSRCSFCTCDVQKYRVHLIEVHNYYLCHVCNFTSEDINQIAKHMQNCFILKNQ
ncbi:uncharacterized protein LOC115879891 isoform X3 [Sitophilus oryzae]|uniref:Uncharacterized protein LOC115879891 isoform X3 n=1 Tax=Sitophilus oryzae TaxID=7048 RepID=A0A6J2XQ54_SITOR|nr:uncharacterized protein LOC115879891 isoform X3 [Sitophilus oryzae]